MDSLRKAFSDAAKLVRALDMSVAVGTTIHWAERSEDCNEYFYAVRTNDWREQDWTVTAVDIPRVYQCDTAKLVGAIARDNVHLLQVVVRWEDSV